MSTELVCIRANEILLPKFFLYNLKDSENNKFGFFLLLTILMLTTEIILD